MKTLSTYAVEGVVGFLDYHAKHAPSMSADAIIDMLIAAGATQLDTEGWKMIAREVVRKTRGELWEAGTELKVVATTEFAYGTAHRPGDRVVVWISEVRDPSIQTYEVVRKRDGLHQILTFHQLEFPFEDWV